MLYAIHHGNTKLEMDEQGWVDVAQLLEVLRRIERWKNVKKSDLENMIDKSEKKDTKYYMKESEHYMDIHF